MSVLLLGKTILTFFKQFFGLPEIKNPADLAAGLDGLLICSYCLMSISCCSNTPSLSINSQ